MAILSSAHLERVHDLLDRLLGRVLCLADEEADSNDQQDDQQGERTDRDEKASVQRVCLVAWKDNYETKITLLGEC